MQKRFSVGLTVAIVTLVGLFSTLGVILPPSFKTVTLIWDYPQLDPQIVFNVYATTDLAEPISNWTLVTNVSTTSCVLPAQYDKQFFTVAASNTVTQLQSAYASK
jgi:hypothetical protein